MINNNGIWQSQRSWNFTENGQNVTIKNLFTNKILSVVENTTEVTEIFLAKDNQNWRKGVPNQEGYFTLTDPNTKMVLTAINSTSLEITGNAK